MSDETPEDNTSVLDNLSGEFTAASKAFLLETMGQSVFSSIRTLRLDFTEKHNHPGYCKINNGEAEKIPLDSEDVAAIRKLTFETLPGDIDIYSNRDKELKEGAEAILERLGEEGRTQFFNEVLAHESSEYFVLPTPEV